LRHAAHPTCQNNNNILNHYSISCSLRYFCLAACCTSDLPKQLSHFKSSLQLLLFALLLFGGTLRIRPAKNNGKILNHHSSSALCATSVWRHAVQCASDLPKTTAKF
jgi:hypothetical protein